MEQHFLNESVLVTGGAGAIGSNLVKWLVGAGANVTVVDDLSSGVRDHLPQGIRFLEHDLSLGLDCLNGSSFSYIFHCAAFFANQNSVDHPLRDLAVNGSGTLNVLNFARGCTELKKLVYLSSSCVYGPRTGVLRVEDPLGQFDTPYAITKHLGEQYVEFFRRHHGLPAITFRLFNSYGPGELPGKYRNVIPNFFELALSGKPLVITGTGEETRDFTFVEDIVQGIVSGALYAGERTIFNLGTGRQTRIIELAEQINRITGNTAGIRFVPRRDWDHITVRCADISASATELGYSPQIGLSEGIERTCAWLKENMNRVPS